LPSSCDIYLARWGSPKLAEWPKHISIMAEVGVLASFAAGLQPSMFLYDSASNIRSAGREIKSVAHEASLLCRVLKQVQSILSKGKAFQVSTNAIQLPQDILDRC
jgi:hypothetical protein